MNDSIMNAFDNATSEENPILKQALKELKLGKLNQEDKLQELHI